MPPESSPSKIGKSVGEKIRAARVALHYTQSKLASPDFSVSYISAIERGQIHPSLRALEIFAARLGIPVTSLLPQPTPRVGQDAAKPQPPEREDNENELALFSAHALIYQNEPMQALALLEKTPAKRLKHIQQLWYRYLLGYAHLVAHHEKIAEHIFSDLSAMIDTAKAAKAEAKYTLHTHILYMQGMTFAAMQNPTQALYLHQRCLQKLEQGSVHDTFLIARTYLQLGIHHTQLDQNFDAFAMFHKAIETFGSIQTPIQTLATCLDLMHYAISQDDYYAAELYAYRIRLSTELQGNNLLRSEAFYYLGLLIMQGDQEEAYVQLSALKEQEETNALVLAAVDARFAEWHFAQGENTEALAYAKTALQLAEPFGDTIFLADALLILGQIEYALELFNEADEHFKQGISLLKLLRSHEQYKYLLHYAQLLEARGREQEAFNYFRLAFQSNTR